MIILITRFRHKSRGQTTKAESVQCSFRSSFNSVSFFDRQQVLRNLSHLKNFWRQALSEHLIHYTMFYRGSSNILKDRPRREHIIAWAVLALQGVGGYWQAGTQYTHATLLPAITKLPINDKQIQMKYIWKYRYKYSYNYRCKYR